MQFKILVIALILFCFGSTVSADTIYVPDDYDKIQWAVYNATANDTIIVRDGTYYENVNVDKKVVIESENGSSECIVDAGGSGNPFALSVDGIRIEGFTVTNSSDSWLGAGIQVASSGNIIRNNKIINNNNGIYIYATSSNDHREDNIVLNNFIRDNRGYGVSIDFCFYSNNTIKDNTFVNDGLFVDHTYLTNVENNTVNGKPLVYLEDVSDLEVNEDAGQVLLVNCNNVTVKNLNLSQTDAGIETWGSEECTIVNNDLKNCYIGISVLDSYYNKIESNRFSNNNYGMLIAYHSMYNTATDNNVSDNAIGIYIGGDGHNTIKENKVEENGNGIQIYSYSYGNNVKNNTVSNSSEWDITCSSKDNFFTNNTLSSNYPTTVSFTYSGAVSLKGVSAPPPDPVGNVNIGKYINATSQSESGWLFLNFSYSDSDIYGIHENSLKVWKYNGSWYDDGWNESRFLDTKNNLVGVKITSFSIFAPLSIPVPVPGPCTDQGSDGIIDNTITVSRTGNCPVIQWAVDNATAGDTIIVRDGTYYENININKKLTIKSENGSDDCIVHAKSTSESVFKVISDYVTIDGFTLIDSQNAGIRLEAKFCQALNNNCSNNHYGIWIDYSSNNTVSNNTCSKNNERGIWLWYSDNNTITLNNCSSNGDDGILIDYSSNNKILNNDFFSNDDSGVFIYYSNNNNFYLNNFKDTVDICDSNNSWHSPDQIKYTYNGKTFTNYLGNYWSDYTNPDNDSDGIGDTPYPIGTEADYYPLMQPFENYTIHSIECGDVTCDDSIDISDVIKLLYYVGYPGQYSLCSEWTGDVTGDGTTDISDVIRLLYYVGYPGQYTLECKC